MRIPLRLGVQAVHAEADHPVGGELGQDLAEFRFVLAKDRLGRGIDENDAEIAVHDHQGGRRPLEGGALEGGVTGKDRDLGQAVTEFLERAGDRADLVTARRAGDPRAVIARRDHLHGLDHPRHRP